MESPLEESGLLETHRTPSHISKTVRPTVKIATTEEDRTDPPLVDPLYLPDSFQIDRPRVPEFSVAIVSVE